MDDWKDIGRPLKNQHYRGDMSKERGLPTDTQEGGPLGHPAFGSPKDKSVLRQLFETWVPKRIQLWFNAESGADTQKTQQADITADQDNHDKNDM